MKRSIILLLVLIATAEARWIPWKNTAAATDPPVITAQTLGTLRNDFTGSIGFHFTVGATPITVTQVGRWVVSGNSATHLVRIADYLTGTTITNGSATVTTSGATAGAYKYATLATPVVLAASTDYAIYSDEVSSGDQFYDKDSTITATSAITLVNAAYFQGTAGTIGSAGDSYGTVNFRYH